jgi:hypothetical protein
MKQNISRTFHWWVTAVALVCLILLSACHDDDDNEGQKTRTVLIYMMAENSLSLFSESDLIEIRNGSQKLGDDDQLLVYYDRAEKDELPWLARIVKGQLRDSVSIADMQISTKDECASDPHIFEKVLSYAFSHYPATAGYGLTLWGHSNGWMKMDSIAYSRGYGVDNRTNTYNYDMGPWLNMSTLKRILKKQPHLEFILADCCNFMCIESIYELREVTDYIVGSPAEIPSPGAPYSTVVPEMFKRQNAAKGIMTKYADEYKDYLLLSVAKTSEMDALAKATRTVLTAINSRLDTKYPDMTGLIYYYNEHSGRYLPQYNILYDAGDFVKKYATEEEYMSWKQAFDRVVIDKVFATSWETNKSWNTYYSAYKMTEEKYHGVSMFVPQELGYYVEYNEDVKMLEWYWDTK